jgi:hypothetical protein
LAASLGGVATINGNVLAAQVFRLVIAIFVGKRQGGCTADASQSPAIKITGLLMVNLQKK